MLLPQSTQRVRAPKGVLHAQKKMRTPQCYGRTSSNTPSVLAMWRLQLPFAFSVWRHPFRDEIDLAKT